MTCMIKDYLVQTYVKNIIVKQMKNYNRKKFNQTNQI